ncbi:MAG: methyltransferase domain-containing protein [Phreatobacter sp.]|uniref:class I SAM-dependent DNA methyltransferase n=1 Tax=Phreatobacter sp. TaxID=1966341 RepID=UPI001A48DD7D|nr:methyltransferase domain-containing protein [Phreatobacter sp.]MBL8569370.1 methyltransferase domain-containing protein [Phreatobacter sp.]
MQRSTTSRSSGDLLADRRYDYAMFARAEGDLPAAADLLAQTLEIVPRWAPAWFALGEVEAAQGRRDEAIAAFREALAQDPSDALGAALALARLGVADIAAAMAPAYVAALFDQYAPRFDSALRAGLAYRGPEILHDAVARSCAMRGRDGTFTRMLDLGCGTGLAAEVFAPRVEVMDGVDLSPRMIDIARQKGIYRDLAVGDLAGFLGQQHAASADLVAAADVFVYLADLAPIARDSARVLVPGGLLAFTVETHPGEGVVLGAGLRYAHAEALVRAVVTGAGLDILLLEAVSTRNEADRPVPGLVVVAGRA